MKSTNYHNAFIAVAADSKAQKGTLPPDNKGKTIAALQHEMIAGHPYQYTSDDVIFSIYALRHDIPESEMQEARKQFFSKGQPCLRASPLSKSYGWGIHNDAQGKVAIYGVESEEYEKYAADDTLEQVKAMRSSKK